METLAGKAYGGRLLAGCALAGRLPGTHAPSLLSVRLLLACLVCVFVCAHMPPRMPGCGHHDAFVSPSAGSESCLLGSCTLCFVTVHMQTYS